MHTLINPHRLALIAAILAGSLAGTWAVTSPMAPIAHEASATRQCSSTICTNRLWLRAPVLRTRAG